MMPEDLREQIAGLEDRIEALARTADSCRKLIVAAKLAIAGCAIGLLGAAATSRLLGSFLFGVSPFDPLVLTLAAVFVLLLVWLASLLPARRAASIDLMSVLRAD